jgi:hypothetical protein
MLADKTPQHEIVSQTLWTLFGTIAYAGVALVLLLATLATFNRCLGRIDTPSLLDTDDSCTIWAATRSSEPEGC